ncbi:MAG: hypothetical protein SGBAC_011838 [Bacillariaceae sp.]
MGRPTLDGIRQASMSTINKGKLMVGLTSEEDMESQVTNDSESTYLDEAASLLCPDMTFQQRLIGFASCFTIGLTRVVKRTLGLNDSEPIEGQVS